MRGGAWCVACVAGLAAVSVGVPALSQAHGAVPVIAPSIPSADRTAGNRVFLEHADVLRKAQNDEFMVVQGNVLFTKGPMEMRCDSAHFYPDTESMDAFGNVSMEQGDTLFVYADELNYDGPSEVAYLYSDAGKDVRLINRDVELVTPVFTYDLRADIGYYTSGGTLTDAHNRLRSIEGEYMPSTKEANFYGRVHLNSHSDGDTLDIFTDTLYYNTDTHVAELYSPSRVINAQATIFTTEGNYNTETNVSNLYARSTIVGSEGGQQLTADTIFYDKAAGYGEGFGRVELTDTANCSIVLGDYGYYDQELDSAFITGHAEMRQYNQGDTLYMHGRYIESVRDIRFTEVPEDTLTGTPARTVADTSHVAVVYPRVRFWRVDMQGVADSIRFTQRDSMLRMYVNPVVWSEQRQIFGDIIELHLNDSTVDRADLPQNAFTAEHIEDVHYSQLSGKQMTAYFTDGEIRHLDVSGNVEIIMYPEEQDSTINKIVNAESSFLSADFEKQMVQRIHMWPETSGTVTPLFLAKKNQFFLSKFKWFEGIRPLDRFDIFVVPEEMEQLMATAPRPVIEVPKAPKKTMPATPPPSALQPAPPPAVEEAPATAEEVPVAVEEASVAEEEVPAAAEETTAAEDSESEN
ncbi:MAG: hypothetical protein K2L21_06420 [Muribaculaceae bacterium]|nr:hypothetical protein [Muribaculaceae bacterium]